MTKSWPQSSYARVHQSLVVHALGEHEEARRALEEVDVTPGNWRSTEAPALLAWLAYGREDEGGRRALDRYCQAHPSASRAERAVLEALAAAWCSVFEVQSVQPQQGLVLRDLLSGEQVEVRERLLTSQVVAYDLLLAWLMPVERHHELTGAVLLLSRMHRWNLVPQARAALVRAREEQPGEPVHTLLRRLGGWLWVQVKRSAQELQQVETMDGKPFRLSKARFTCQRVAEVARVLREDEQHWLEEDERTFTWVDRAGWPELGPGPLVLGTVRLRQGKVELETNSVERLERGKALLVERVGPSLRHEGDEVGEQLQVPKPDPALQPRPVEQVAPLVQAHRRQLEHFADRPLPLLEGLSPRQALATPLGRSHVLELLKDEENILSRLAPSLVAEVAAVYRELGLRRDELVALEVYDQPVSRRRNVLLMDSLAGTDS